MSDYSLPEEKSKTLESVMESLNQKISPVPGFTPPALEKKALYCPLPDSCTQEDKNEFRSAAAFLASVATEVKAWRTQLPENYQPAVMAILQGGVQIHVMKLAQVSFDGIRIEGLLQNNPVTVFAHQSTVQMMCFAMEIKEEKERNPIGFIWPDRNEEV